MKAKNMTRRTAIPYLERLIDKVDGKKKRRALEIAVLALQSLTRNNSLLKSVKKIA